MDKEIHLKALVSDQQAGLRLDQALSQMFPDYSRSRLQTWIKAGQVTVDGKELRPRDRVYGGEEVVIETVIEEDEGYQSQDIPLDVVYEDDSLLVINKPAGLVVHPAVGNRSGTMLNALLHYAPELAGVPRAGIIHRLDKNTTGLLVVAKTLAAHKDLVEKLQSRDFEREYQTVVNGVMTAGGTIDAPIGRHPVDRTRMAVNERGKPAVTHYRVVERFRAHTWVRVQLETGRTHQIRVHMAYKRYPIAGDPTYGGRLRLPSDSSESLINTLRSFRRQALHAARLGLQHPETGEMMQWEAPIPEDMEQLIQALQQDVLDHSG